MNIVPFQFNTQQIRVTTDSAGEPWFVAADVLSILGLDRKAMERLDEDEKGVNSIHTPGGTQQMTVVNEPGLYSLVLGSRKPEAKTFKRWVTHEVLPQIRKTGSYGFKAPTSMVEALQLALDQAKQIESQQQQLEAQKPAVEFVNRYIDESELTISRRELAKLLDLKEPELRKFLLDEGICYVNARNDLIPYAEHERAGRCGLRPYVNQKTKHAGHQLFFTRKGHLYIADRLRKSREIQ